MKNWRTKEGATIPIVKMDDTHLVNWLEHRGSRAGHGAGAMEAVIQNSCGHQCGSKPGCSGASAELLRIAFRGGAQRGIEQAPIKGRKAATVGELQRVGRMFNFDD